MFFVFHVFTGRAQTCQYLVYSEADFEAFRPQGRHVALMGVKFGTEEGTKGSLLRDFCAIFTKFAAFVPHFRMR